MSEHTQELAGDSTNLASQTGKYAHMHLVNLMPYSKTTGHLLGRGEFIQSFQILPKSFTKLATVKNETLAVSPNCLIFPSNTYLRVQIISCYEGLLFCVLEQNS
jgi:hypothetical protein